MQRFLLHFDLSHLSLHKGSFLHKLHIFFMHSLFPLHSHNSGLFLHNAFLHLQLHFFLHFLLQNVSLKSSLQNFLMQ